MPDEVPQRLHAPPWLHVPRAVVAVFVVLLVSVRFLSEPTTDPLVVVFAGAMAAFFLASSVEPVYDHPLYPTATGVTVTALLVLWTATSANPRVPAMLTVTAAIGTLVAYTYVRERAEPAGA